MGEIKPISGEYRFSDTIKSIGYYEQELKWENTEDIPLNIISREYPDLSPKEVRKHLADCRSKKRACNARNKHSKWRRTIKSKIMQTNIKAVQFANTRRANKPFRRGYKRRTKKSNKRI